MKLIRLAAILAAVPLLAALSPEENAALERIQAQHLRANVQFLASDLLEGRGTPSRGLDIAAEYIASQFRAAGLETLGDNGYFQTAKFVRRRQDLSSLHISVGPVEIPRSDVRLTTGTIPSLEGAGAFKLDAERWREQLGDATRGKVALANLPDLRRVPDGERARTRETLLELDRALRANGVPLVIAVGGGVRLGGSMASLYPEDEPQGVLVVAVDSGELRKVFDAAQPGPVEGSVAVKVPAAQFEPAVLRNVAGLLRGSDPALKDTYILVSAHHDHMGIDTRGTGEDKIFNGANDDASGVSCLLEMASSIGAMKTRPRRSIVFVTFFGEELGLMGAQWYSRHPAVPLERTIVNINMEHMGRTDQMDGPRVGTATMTGFGYSTLHTFLERAAAESGWKFADDPPRTNQFFNSSDNAALAQRGVVAHTMTVAFIFPDYHKVGDEWPKLDYDNMAGADRFVTAGVLLLAGSDEVPQWNDLPVTGPYREAARKLALPAAASQSTAPTTR